ncbi:hypothetical protein [uncultured Cardiobacterium sp.]|uniref:hypothetical protein n=1 Tax=uncultured Cardiobacterium sp. TaxID=417619 RepID=UPI002602293F|nr:hypothetical protein [uncultured Cardiobacterium sp.]
MNGRTLTLLCALALTLALLGGMLRQDMAVGAVGLLLGNTAISGLTLLLMLQQGGKRGQQ